MKNNRDILGGFTVLETLVALFLIGSITLLIGDGITRVLKLRERLGDYIDRGQDGLIINGWFANSVNGIISGEIDFEGDNTHFSGLTLMPLDNLYGTPSKFEWQLANDDEGYTVLSYIGFDDEKALKIAIWAGPGKFTYSDGNGEWLNEWPPLLGEEPAPFPKFIKFEAERNKEPWVIIAPTMLPTEFTKLKDDSSSNQNNKPDSGDNDDDEIDDNAGMKAGNDSNNNAGAEKPTFPNFKLNASDHGGAEE